MSKDLNQCNFIGRLGRNPEIKYTQSGDAIATFSLAVGETYKDKSGQKVEKTEWIRCVAWRKLAEIIGEYLSKGSQVFVSGKFTTETWEKDGVKREVVKIVVNNMQMLGGKAKSGEPENNAQVEHKQPADEPTDDLPF